MSVSERFYRLLLKAYSPDFRRNAGRDMAEAFRDAYTATRARRGALGVAWLWIATVTDVVFSAIPDRMAARRRRDPSHRSLQQKTARLMEHVEHDARYALRMLRKSPGFTMVAAFTVALGIGATTTIFSVVNGMLLRPAAGVAAPNELVTGHTVSPNGSTFHSFSYLNYADYRDGANGLAGFAAYSTFMGSLSTGDDPELTAAMMASHNYFDVLGARPMLGRFFLSDEERPDAVPAVVVLGHGTWQQRFGTDSTIVGQTITLNGRPFTIIGVAEPGFSGHGTVTQAGLWIPIAAHGLVQSPGRFGQRGLSWLETVGRRAPGVSTTQVQEAMTLIAGRLAEAYPDVNLDRGIDIRNYHNVEAAAFGPVAGFMSLLLVVSGLVLLIASVNVASMLLSRAVGRGQELALRLALGASRGRLVRQLVTESVLLFLLGAAGGTLIAAWTTNAITAVELPIPVPLLFDFSPDVRVLGFTLLVALATGVFFGLAPALQVTRPDLMATLKNETLVLGSRSRLRGVLVVAQVAGSAVLLVGAGLFSRALARADSIELGMDPEMVHAVGVSVGLHNYTAEEGRQFFAGLMEGAAALPQVGTVAMIDNLPLSLSNQTTVFVVDGRPPVPNEGLQRTDFAIVTPGYFDALRIPLMEGRSFSDLDRNESPDVVIINETIARRMWPGESAVGKNIGVGQINDAPQHEIVGVVADSKYRSLGDDGRQMIFLPFAQNYRAGMTLVARAGGVNAVLTRPLRAVVTSLDRDLPVNQNAPVPEIMGISLLPNRIAAVLATIFGVLGLTLAAVGLYGVLAYMVSQRAKEMGIRIALGAEAGHVRGLILRDGFRLTGLGLGIGFVAAFGATRLVRNLLYGVSPTDPLTFGGIGLLLLAIAALASYVPARRATRTDPMNALRTE